MSVPVGAPYVKPSTEDPNVQILVQVPPGYIARSKDGKELKGGQFPNHDRGVKISGPDATWSLEADPNAEKNPETPQKEVKQEDKKPDQSSENTPTETIEDKKESTDEQAKKITNILEEAKKALTSDDYEKYIDLYKKIIKGSQDPTNIDGLDDNEKKLYRVLSRVVKNYVSGNAEKLVNEPYFIRKLLDDSFSPEEKEQYLALAQQETRTPEEENLFDGLQNKLEEVRNEWIKNNTNIESKEADSLKSEKTYPENLSPEETERYNQLLQIDDTEMSPEQKKDFQELDDKLTTPDNTEKPNNTEYEKDNVDEQLSETFTNQIKNALFLGSGTNLRQISNFVKRKDELKNKFGEDHVRQIQRQYIQSRLGMVLANDGKFTEDKIEYLNFLTEKDSLGRYKYADTITEIYRELGYTSEAFIHAQNYLEALDNPITKKLMGSFTLTSVAEGLTDGLYFNKLGQGKRTRFVDEPNLGLETQETDGQDKEYGLKPIIIKQQSIDNLEEPEDETDESIKAFETKANMDYVNRVNTAGLHNIEKMALLSYLVDVSPDGKSTFVNEGKLIDVLGHLLYKYKTGIKKNGAWATSIPNQDEVLKTFADRLNNLDKNTIDFSFIDADEGEIYKEIFDKMTKIPTQDGDSGVLSVKLLKSVQTAFIKAAFKRFATKEGLSSDDLSNLDDSTIQKFKDYVKDSYDVSSILRDIYIDGKDAKSMLLMNNEIPKNLAQLRRLGASKISDLGDFSAIQRSKGLKLSKVEDTEIIPLDEKETEEATDINTEIQKSDQNPDSPEKSYSLEDGGDLFSGKPINILDENGQVKYTVQLDNDGNATLETLNGKKVNIDNDEILSNIVSGDFAGINSFVDNKLSSNIKKELTTTTTEDLQNENNTQNETKDNTTQEPEIKPETETPTETPEPENNNTTTPETAVQEPVIQEAQPENIGESNNTTTNNTNIETQEPVQEQPTQESRPTNEITNNPQKVEEKLPTQQRKQIPEKSKTKQTTTKVKEEKKPEKRASQANSTRLKDVLDYIEESKPQYSSEDKTLRATSNENIKRFKQEVNLAAKYLSDSDFKEFSSLVETAMDNNGRIKDKEKFKRFEDLRKQATEARNSFQSQTEKPQTKKKPKIQPTQELQTPEENKPEQKQPEINDEDFTYEPSVFKKAGDNLPPAVINSLKKQGFNGDTKEFFKLPEDKQKQLIDNAVHGNPNLKKILEGQGLGFIKDKEVPPQPSLPPHDINTYRIKKDTPMVSPPEVTAENWQGALKGLKDKFEGKTTKKLTVVISGSGGMSETFKAWPEIEKGLTLPDNSPAQKLAEKYASPELSFGGDAPPYISGENEEVKKSASGAIGMCSIDFSNPENSGKIWINAKEIDKFVPPKGIPQPSTALSLPTSLARTKTELVQNVYLHELGHALHMEILRGYYLQDSKSKALHTNLTVRYKKSIQQFAKGLKASGVMPDDEKLGSAIENALGGDMTAFNDLLYPLNEHIEKITKERGNRPNHGASVYANTNYYEYFAENFLLYNKYPEYMKRYFPEDYDVMKDTVEYLAEKRRT